MTVEVVPVVNFPMFFNGYDVFGASYTLRGMDFTEVCKKDEEEGVGLGIYGSIDLNEENPEEADYTLEMYYDPKHFEHDMEILRQWGNFTIELYDIRYFNYMDYETYCKFFFSKYDREAKNFEVARDYELEVNRPRVNALWEKFSKGTPYENYHISWYYYDGGHINFSGPPIGDNPFVDVPPIFQEFTDFLYKEYGIE